MEYKIGDEVLVKARIIGSRNGVSRLLVQSQQDKFFVENNNVIPAQDMTAEEAWEIAKKLKQMNKDELLEAFRTNVEYIVLRDFTPQQAKAKIEAWEQEKKIRVGDVVTITNNDPTSITNGKTVHTGVITSAHSDNYYDLILGDGLAWSYVAGEKLKKTGRRIDITGLLEQIGESDA